MAGVRVEILSDKFGGGGRIYGILLDNNPRQQIRDFSRRYVTNTIATIITIGTGELWDKIPNHSFD